MLHKKMGHAPPPAGQWHAPGGKINLNRHTADCGWKTQALAACGGNVLSPRTAAQ
ncbi:Hypothetical Protein XCAW_01671 [Xanthomonas citri subsp. citri Aw12879]|nr:Hypothetical Protein XCAW_01671 [Xanthomonas citri subsp. citri Aw12879]